MSKVLKQSLPPTTDNRPPATGHRTTLAGSERRRRAHRAYARGRHVPAGLHVVGRHADARGAVRANRAPPRIPQSCRASLPGRSRFLICGSGLSLAKIECIKERSGACTRCWPAHRLDRHGYIDMGTDSVEQGPAWAQGLSSQQSPPSQDRCFLQPPAPTLISSNVHYRRIPHPLSGMTQELSSV